MARFPDTQWSLIRRSGDDGSVRHAAFSQLVRDYRPAIVAYCAARLPLADAEDATQSFLAASFEHRWWARADAASGSFRGFLLLLLRRHLGHLRSARDTLELDTHAEPVDPAPDAERQFDARFAMLLTRRALDLLRARYREREREALFEQLVALLHSHPEHGELQSIAATMGLRANTLTVELARLRKRLREALQDELRQLCADEAAFEVEWQALQAVLGRG